MRTTYMQVPWKPEGVRFQKLELWVTYVAAENWTQISAKEECPLSTIGLPLQSPLHGTF